MSRLRSARGPQTWCTWQHQLRGPEPAGMSCRSCEISSGRNPLQRARRLAVQGAAGLLRPRGSLDRVLERRRAATPTEQRRVVAYFTSAARADLKLAQLGVYDP